MAVTAALPIVSLSEYRIFAPGVIAFMGLIRHSKPKLPRPPQRLGTVVGVLFIGFLCLLLIHAFHPFPPAAITAGRILAWVIIVPFAIYMMYLDFRIFQQREAAIASR